MPDSWPPASAPRRRAPQPNYFARRLVALVVAFLVLLPVARLFDRSGGSSDQVIKASGDAATATTVPSTPAAPAPATAATAVLAPAQAAAPAASSAPKPVATTARKKPPAATAPKAAKPAAKAAANSAATPKVAPTTAAKAAKPVATTAPKPVPTPAPKPVPAPAPAPAPPPRTYAAAEIEAIIRAAWPDDLEDHALAIAYRESKLVPTSRNYCCYGLFAIYYEAGKGLLNSIGVTSAEQLFDPVVNSRAAYELYKVAGWDPWKL